MGGWGALPALPAPTPCNHFAGFEFRLRRENFVENVADRLKRNGRKAAALAATSRPCPKSGGTREVQPPHRAR
jgi:hypothetical protein